MHVKHLDLYGAANNHVMQHGGSAYREMLWYLGDYGVQYVGSLERRSTTFFHEGKKVGTFAKREQQSSKGTGSFGTISCPHINPTFVVGTCCSDCNDSCMVFDCR